MADQDQILNYIRRLEADLLECRDYLGDHSDVVDGPHGQPYPNKALSLITMIDLTLQRTTWLKSASLKSIG